MDALILDVIVQRHYYSQYYDNITSIHIAREEINKAPTRGHLDSRHYTARGQSASSSPLTNIKEKMTAIQVTGTRLTRDQCFALITEKCPCIVSANKLYKPGSRSDLMLATQLL